MKFGNITETEYESFLKLYPQKNFLHSSNFGKIRSKYGWNYEFLGLKDNDKIIAATMLVSRKEFFDKKEFYAIRGFLIDYNNLELLSFFTKKIAEYVKQNNGFILRIDPYLIKQERDIDGKIVENGKNNLKAIENLKSLGFVEKNSEQAKWMFTLDLKGKTMDMLMKNMRSNTRRYINKTFKEELVIRELSYDELDKFLAVTDDTSKRKNFANKNLEYYQYMYKLFGEENQIKFLVAELYTKDYLKLLSKKLDEETETLNSLISKNSNKIREHETTIKRIKSEFEEAKTLAKIDDVIVLSASMFVLYGDEIVYVAGGNYQEYMHFYAQYRIQYEMIKYGVENNFNLYNFYGISGNFDEKDSRYGVYKFKKGFNGQVVELIGEYKLPINKPFYLAYNAVNCIKNIIRKLVRRS